MLGASSDGLLRYTYLDAVKLAGHSCPTVAGAYLMVMKALASLYRVAFRSAETYGSSSVQRWLMERQA